MFQAGWERQDRPEAAAPARCTCSGRGRSSTWGSGSRLFLQQQPRVNAKSSARHLSLTKQNAHSRSAQRRTRRRSAAGRIRDAAAGAPSSQQMLSVPSHRGPSAKGAQRGPQANTGSPFLSLSLLSPTSEAKGPRGFARLHTQSCTGMLSGTARKSYCTGAVARKCADGCCFRADSIVTYKQVLCVQVN